ncbi:MAG: hypothetical protein ABW318_11580 [Vicinamibacterales bacterium]
MPDNALGPRTLAQFVHARHNSGVWAFVLLVTVAVCTNFISDGLTVVRLLPQQELVASRTLYGRISIGVNVALLVAIAGLWIANSTALMRRAILLTNGLFTAQLFLAVVLIVARLAQSVKTSVGTLIVDAVIIFVTDILIFALWYWFIDSATTRPRDSPVPERWDFLFPQRQASYPGYADWTPNFLDYLFLAYTTSVAFSPTDTLPLSRVAKVLMITQSAIALIAITAVAGTAINLLAGSA